MQVLKSFPLHPTLYADDVAQIITPTIERYGSREWQLIVQTNELHGHLGIYSTIGAKMGLYARELLPSDHLHVTSYAGEQPPLSCMNDGLQVSTASTLGHGLIAINKATPRPEAQFEAEGKTITLRLKAQYAQQIADDIAKGVALYGTHSPAYWEYVRTLALRYWQEMDRREIFETVSD